LSTVDLAGMEIFARVAETRSFSAAARRLGVSKSVVSKHISRLEQNLGVRLLNRTTRSLSLTEIGEQFYRRCAEIVAAAEDAERQAMHLQAQPRGVLKIAAPTSFGMLHVAPALTDLLRRCPELHVDLTLTNRVVNLVEEGFDMSLLIEPPPNTGVVARPIARLPRCVCASPDYIADRGAPESPEALANHQCILFTGTPSPRRWVLNGSGRDLMIGVDGRVCINNLNAIRLAALAGAGIAMLPLHLVHGDLVRGQLVALLPDHPPAAATLYAMYPANRHVSAKVRAFIDFAVERFSDKTLTVQQP
jgi:DNA-binding transcriptional LysR family regulator